jgi:ABC-type molybdate transport system substrate-binding protein
VTLEVAREEAPPIVYPAAVLASSTAPEAREFLDHLQSAEARVVFTRLGFEPLDEARAP